MADAAQGVAIDTASSLIRELRKAFLELKAYKDASENNIQWKDIEEHFLNMETTFKRKTEELEAKEKEYEEKESETRLMIMEREAAVVAKEQDLLDHIQELKDAAVSTIAETRSKYKPAEDNSPYKESKLNESFPPVPLLKTYLKDLRRNSQGKGGNSGGAAGAQNDANTQELTALRAVIRCVEDYKLEAQYPLDSLHKRVVQLDKSKSDKKRHVEFGKSQPPPKKARANGGPFRNSSGGGGGGGRRGGGGGSRHAPPNFNERATSYTGFAESYPHAVPNTYTYQIPSQPASFGQQNGDQRLYYYPQQDNRVNATSYSAAPPNYGNYMGSASQPSQQPYM